MSALKPQQEYASIMSGICEANFENPSVPCQLLLSGNHSFPLVMNSQGQVLMAASQYGSGRIVVFSHETQMTAYSDVTLNALNWLKGNPSDNVSVGVQKNTGKEVVDNLHKAGHNVIMMDNFSSDQGIGVYVTFAHDTEEDAKNIVTFMKSGGGVLIGGQALWWASQTGQNTLLQFPGNQVSGVAGIHFSDLHGDKERVAVLPDIPTSWKSVKLQYDFKNDLQTLLKDVSDFEWQQSVASEILVHGRLSFPFATTEDGRAFMAGGYYGKGRVVVAAHESFFGRESMTGLWDNVLHWLDQNRQGVVGVQQGCSLSVLKRSGLDCEQTGFRSDLSVFVRTAYSDDHIEEIQKFVVEGGGLLIGGHAWYWSCVHPGENYLTQFPGNKLLNPMGMSLSSETIGEGFYKAPDASVSIKDTYHFRHLLYRLAGAATNDWKLNPREESLLRKLADDCVVFLRMENYNCYSYQEIVGVLTDILKNTGLPQSAKDHFILPIAACVYDVCPNQKELLCCLVKDIPVLQTVRDQRINISVNTGDVEEWISTGLYLTPGMKTHLSIPINMVNNGWQVQINCHTDILRHNKLLRAPCVFKRVPVTSEMVKVDNLWGGLIYLVAPPHTNVTDAEVLVQGAVPAPYFKSGVTSLNDWSHLRKAPSPWAELEFENIILTVPSDVVRSLERPDELAALWDRIMRAVADLAAIPPKFERKERFVCDVQISAGWMHSGYPIMAHNASDKELVKAREYQGMWGPIHELGHNQQRAGWNFPPNTTEATNNLWSVYVNETILKVPRAEAHEALTPKNRRMRIKDYIKKGRKLSDWEVWVALETYLQAHEALTPNNRKMRIEDYIEKGRNMSNWEVWVALETYLQLQEKFGWSPFKKVFAAYHNIKNVPEDNDGKINLFAVTFSETVGMDLSGFFQAWGWPIRAETKNILSDLPAWNDHPMAQN